MTAHANLACDYAAALLRDIGSNAKITGDCEHPAMSWARSGLMHVTGLAEGPGLMCPAPLAATADGAAIAFAALTNTPPQSGAALLGQRARLMGLHRNGTTSPGGMTKLLRARDGWLALSLVRPEDWSALPALFESACNPTWQAVADEAAAAPVQHLLARARLLGLAAARADRLPPRQHWLTGTIPTPRNTPPNRKPIVADLSSLWAGPLCGALLHRAGAVVMKVESATRPDGARSGHGGFFDFLNAGKASVALDWRSTEGINALRHLLLRADIVIESARPRALRQLGLNAETILPENPNATWVSITAHGRSHPQKDWAGFGDDAAASAGLCHLMHEAHGKMVFCGDAIADPLTGLHAAVAAYAGWLAGGAGLLSLSLSSVTAHCAAFAPAENPAARAAAWTRLASRAQAHPHKLPKPPGLARQLGADTREVLAGMAAAC
jgi:hypothetical protein